MGQVESDLFKEVLGKSRADELGAESDLFRSVLSTSAPRKTRPAPLPGKADFIGPVKPLDLGSKLADTLGLPQNAEATKEVQHLRSEKERLQGAIAKNERLLAQISSRYGTDAPAAKTWTHELERDRMALDQVNSRLGLKVERKSKTTRAGYVTEALNRERLATRDSAEQERLRKSLEKRDPQMFGKVKSDLFKEVLKPEVDAETSHYQILQKLARSGSPAVVKLDKFPAGDPKTVDAAAKQMRTALGLQGQLSDVLSTGINKVATKGVQGLINSIVPGAIPDWYLDVPEVQERTKTVSHFGEYLVPGLRQVQGAADLMGLAGTAAENPAKAAEGLVQGVNPFEPGIHPEDRVIRGLTAIGLVVGLNVGKRKITDQNIAKDLQSQFGLTADEAAYTVKQVRDLATQANLQQKGKVAGTAANFWENLFSKRISDVSRTIAEEFRRRNPVDEGKGKAAPGYDFQFWPEEMRTNKPAPRNTKALERDNLGKRSTPDPVPPVKPVPPAPVPKPTPKLVDVAPKAGKLGGLVVGKGKAISPADESKYDIEYRVVPLSSLVVSHDAAGKVNPNYPGEGAQMRDRSLPGELAEVDRKAKALDPDRLLLDFHSTDRGAPLVGEDGVVESGNGRTIAIQVAKEKYPWQYKKYVEELVKKHPDAKGIENPVLVQVRLGSTDARVRKQVGMEANRGSSSEMTEVEKARQDADALPAQFERRFEMVGKTLEDALGSSRNRQLAQEFVNSLPASERASMIDSEGKVSEPARERMARAIMFKVLGEKSIRTLYAAYQDADFSARVFGGIQQVAGDLARLQDSIDSGGNSVGKQLRDELVTALEYIDTARGHKGGMAKWFEQGSLEERSAAAMKIGKALAEAKSKEKVADVVRGLLRAATDSSGGMFGDLAFKDAAAVVESVLGDRTVGASAGDFAHNVRPSTRPAWTGEMAPEVMVHVERKTSKQPWPRMHRQAKSGDMAAAIDVVREMVDPAVIAEIRKAIRSSKPIVVAVHGEEASGLNKIPMAYAAYLSEQLGLDLDTSIVQTNRPQKTGQDAVYRLVNRVTFAGDVKRGQTYLLVDDYLTMGGTLADLRGYIEGRGGKVVLATSLMSARDSSALALKPETLQELRDAVPGIDEFWQKEFGYGIEGLTNSEAAAVVRQARKGGDLLNTLRNRRAEAKQKGSGRGSSKIAESESYFRDFSEEVPLETRKRYGPDRDDPKLLTDEDLETASLAIDEQVEAIRRRRNKGEDVTEEYYRLLARQDDLDAERARRAGKKDGAGRIPFSKSKEQASGYGVSGRLKPDGLPGGFDGELPDLIEAIQKIAGRRILQGRRKRKGATGVYYADSAQTTIRKVNDVDTAAHEQAHALDDKYGIVGDWALALDINGNPEASPFDAELEWFWQRGGSASPEQSLPYNRAEGVAEYIRALIVNPEEARRLAPEFTKWFESKVPQEVLDRIGEASELVRRWYGSSSLDKARSSVRTKKPPKKSLKEKIAGRTDDDGNYRTSPLDYGRMAHHDVLAPFVSAVQEALSRRGMKLDGLRPSNNPVLLARGFGYFNMRYDAVLEHGMVKPDGTVVTPPAKYLVRSLDMGTDETLNRDLADLETLLVSERVSEKARILEDEAADKILRKEIEIQNRFTEKKAEFESAVRKQFEPDRQKKLGMAQGAAKVAKEFAKKQIKDPKKLQKRLDSIDAKLLNELSRIELDFHVKMQRALDLLLKNEFKRGERFLERYTSRVVKKLQADLKGLTGAGGGYRSSTDVHREAVAQIQADPVRYARLAVAAAGYRQWADTVLQYMVGKGRLSKEAYVDIKKRNKQYAAMQRVIDETASGPGRPGGALASAKDAVKRFTGSSRQVESPLANLLENTYKAMREADRNEVMQAFVKLLSVRRGLYQGEPVELASIGQRVDRGTPGAVRVWVKGDEQHWLFEKGIEESLRRMTDVYMPTVIGKIFSVPARIKRWGVTKFPKFQVRNRIRDTQHTLLFSRETTHLLDWVVNATPEEKRLYSYFGGGLGRGMFADNAQDFYALRDAIIEEMRADGRFSIVRTLKGGIKWYDDLTANSERAPRIAAIRAARRAAQKKYKNLYDQELYAQGAGRELLDFAQGGSISKFISRYFAPFYNAGVQGLRATVELGLRKPRRLLWRMLMMLAVPSLAVYLWNKIHGADKEYQTFQGYQKDTHWLIFNPSNGGWVAIPKPFEVGVASSALDRALEGGPRPFEGYSNSVTNALIPADEQTFMGPIVPWLEVDANYDYFRRRNIVPKYELDVDLSLRKGNANASAFGQLLQGYTGKDARQVDHITKGFLADAGMWILNGSDLLAKKEMDTNPVRALTGLVEDSPGTYAPDVVWVRDLARSVRAQDPLKDLSDAVYAAKSPEEKKKAKQALVSAARDLRQMLERAVQKNPKRKVQIVHGALSSGKVRIPTAIGR